jgi:hypothetical protein
MMVSPSVFAPIVDAGNHLLFSSLETHLVNGLPLESIEWRRSYGRPPKTVVLEAQFEQFQREKALKKAERHLIGVPMLHTFWTDCSDLDTYKADVKVHRSKSREYVNTR